MEEVNADREAHGKKPFDDDDEPPKATEKAERQHLQEETGEAKEREKHGS